MSSFLQGIVILHGGTQAFHHMMETDFGIPEDHEIYDYIKLITHPDELTAEDYPKMWDVYITVYLDPQTTLQHGAQKQLIRCM